MGVGGYPGGGGTLFLLCYHRVIVRRALSLLSTSSSLGWCGGLQLNVMWPPGAPPHPTPDHTTLCVHPDRSLARSAAATAACPGQEGGRCHGNLRVLSREEMVQRNNRNPPPPQNPSWKDPSPPHVHPTLLSNALSLSLLLILNLSIYLYSHLFTFSFKISAYKRVYKLKDNFLLVLSL